jgi:hypothetical protein
MALLEAAAVRSCVSAAAGCCSDGWDAATPRTALRKTALAAPLNPSISQRPCALFLVEVTVSLPENLDR